MRKIVIIPEFCETHLVRCQIPNLIEVLDPDIIIYNSGLFPSGPEGHTLTSPAFCNKWCHPDLTNVGFDYDELLQLEKENPKVRVQRMRYNTHDPNINFLKAISTFPHDFQPEVGDLIFPLEPDAFFHEDDAQLINRHLEKLNPGDGLQCKWMDFLETQFYTECINLINPKYRRIAYCFDNAENYQAAMNGFTSQNYPALKKLESIFVRHYAWFRPGKYKELRYDLIARKDPQYWKDFDNGLEEIRKIKPWVRSYDNGEIIDTRSVDIPEKVLIRPSRSDGAKYATFVDVPHPKAIRSHPNFVK